MDQAHQVEVKDIDLRVMRLKQTINHVEIRPSGDVLNRLSSRNIRNMPTVMDSIVK